ncbi:SDR family oxidoreductase [Pseudorhizobium pelagicum]|uniref:Oxidoreductase n=1 Tax=Pseudorhizobium pelagicum TaxID=1509405 RepID=A0A922NZ29_9HYPH|nr:SDR family oxidoreductase [Pseudorhizobium pelagicum]KEQ03732.1 oxidoreductase [Pseudorhizobium pelagicum]KEQ05487.1 oxidoreductase [Pseudorhizobium pelagicum]
MQMMIFGCGYSGKAIARLGLTRGATVSGTTRGEHNAASLAADGVRALVFDGAQASPELALALSQATHLVQSIPPGPDGDPLLRLAGHGIRKLCPKLEWIGYLSTVGVYGDYGGDWVDESNECRPSPGRSQERVAAEAAWLAEGEAAGVPVAILRLAGIYGPGRNGFVNLQKGTARRIVKKDQVFNRIRVEDIAEATLFLAEGRHGGIFNITDDEPAPPQDVIAEAARLMGVEPPPELPFETADMTPMARSFYGANKRISNSKIRKMGFQFRYPEYRMSLRQLWETGLWDDPE